MCAALLLAPSGPDDLWLKCEFLQHCGVFKTRGAFNRQLSAIERGKLGDAGIVVASGGNAGLAQAYAARELGVRATVFVPETAPVVKVERIRRYGADVRLAGTEYAKAQQAALAFAREHGAAYAHAYDQPEVAAGAGTLAEEVLDDEPGIATVVVAVNHDGSPLSTTRSQPASPSMSRCPGSPPTRWGPAASATWRLLRPCSRRRCRSWWTTTTSSPRATTSGSATASPPSTVPPQRWRRCSRAPTCRLPASGWPSWCAEPTPTSPHWREPQPQSFSQYGPGR